MWQYGDKIVSQQCSGNVLSPVDNKPLPEKMLIYHSLGSMPFIVDCPLVLAQLWILASLFGHVQ